MVGGSVHRGQGDGGDKGRGGGGGGWGGGVRRGLSISWHKADNDASVCQMYWVLLALSDLLCCSGTCLRQCTAHVYVMECEVCTSVVTSAVTGRLSWTGGVRV